MITRRDAIKAGVAAAAALTVTPLEATRMLPRLFPPIGIGTARRYDVGTSEEERSPLRETLREFVKLGGTLVDTAPSYATRRRWSATSWRSWASARSCSWRRRSARDATVPRRGRRRCSSR